MQIVNEKESDTGIENDGGLIVLHDCTLQDCNMVFTDSLLPEDCPDSLCSSHLDPLSLSPHMYNHLRSSQDPTTVTDLVSGRKLPHLPAPF